MEDELIFIIIFSGAWSLIGIIFLIIGVAVLKNKKRKQINCTSKIYGKVIDIVRHETYKKNGIYSSSWYPVFEYNIGELKYIKESLYGRSQPKYAVGQSVEVYYNPEDHNEFYIKGETVQKTLGKVFTIVGIVAISIGVFCAILIKNIYELY